MSAAALQPAQVRAFAEAWFALLSQHRSFAEVGSVLAGEAVEMVFTEKRLQGLDDVKAWYLGGHYRDGSKAVGVCNVFFDERHNIRQFSVAPTEEGVEVEVVVGWQASWFVPPEPSPRQTSANAHQRWRLVPAPAGPNRFAMVILSYNAVVQPLEFAPGFATL
jgi:hypothetical protein